MGNTDKNKIQITVNEVGNDNASDASSKTMLDHRSRDVTRGLWELARFHTREAWLCWYPASLYPSVIRIQYGTSTYIIQSGGRVWLRGPKMLRSIHMIFAEYSLASGVV